MPEDAKSHWDFSKWVPDVVLINLATNDFGRKIPDEKGWTGAYESFLKHVRKNYPNAEIYVASGSMMGDWGENKQLTTLKKYLAKIVADRKAAGDGKVHEIDFAPQDRKDGLVRRLASERQNAPDYGQETGRNLAPGFGVEAVRPQSGQNRVTMWQLFRLTRSQRRRRTGTLRIRMVLARVGSMK